jgi:hypothetical protein
MTTDNLCFYFQNRLIQTSQTGGRRYSDTSPFSIPWTIYKVYSEECAICNVKQKVGAEFVEWVKTQNQFLHLNKIYTQIIFMASFASQGVLNEGSYGWANFLSNYEFA